MTTERASARPHKRFFLEMFTRDISLEDCILDLVDNSIDGLIRSKPIRTSALSLGRRAQEKTPPENVAQIKIKYTDKALSISDNCGGIDKDYAMSEVFTFGHGRTAAPGRLGVYGIGLKRAIFKLGNRFQMTSQTANNGFSVDLDVGSWAENDTTLDDWTIPLVARAAADRKAGAGTEILVTELRPEVQMLLREGSITTRLHKEIGRTYSFFLERWVGVEINGKAVEALAVPIGRSQDVRPAVEKFEEGGVRVALLASLAARVNGEWRQETAGWYVACNGRLVVTADKSDLTGWSAPHTQFTPKYRGFVGLATFESDNPLLLPWTTTKRGLNRESPVYQRARSQMTTVGRPILSFLNSMYPSEPAAAEAQREVADHVKPVDIQQVASGRTRPFEAILKRKPRTTVRVQCDAEIGDLNKIKKHLARPRLTASEIGRLALDYYLKSEGLA